MSKIKFQTVFNKGDYVVLLNSCYGMDRWQTSIPINYCYKLKKHSHSLCFFVEKDLSGSSSNGWSSSYYKNSELNLRIATDLEIIEYNRLDKPFDVTSFNTENIKEDYSYLIELFKKLKIK